MPLFRQFGSLFSDSIIADLRVFENDISHMHTGLPARRAISCPPDPKNMQHKNRAR